MPIVLKYVNKLIRNKKNLYAALIIGIIILIIPNLFGISNNNAKVSNNGEKIQSKEINKAELENILSKVYGAGKTKVMITYDTGVEKVTVKNIKSSKSSSNDTGKSGGEDISNEITEEQEIVMCGSGSSQTPFITKEIHPQVRGVLVVAEGAGNETVKYNLINAVAAVLDVPYYRIQVLQKSN